jgi:hypothetical protein
MKNFKRVLAVAAVSIGLVVAGTVAAAPANAQSSFVRTKSCAPTQSVQIAWKSTGVVDLWRFQGNSGGLWSPTLMREVTQSGSYSWNSGMSTVTWGFGVSTGNVSSYTETCVAFN